HSVSAPGDRVRAHLSWRPTDDRALGAATARLGLFAISPGRRLSSAAGWRYLRHGGPAGAGHRHWSLSLHPQPDVPRAPDLPHRACDHLLVLVRAAHPDRARHLVPPPRPPRRGAAREDFWRRIQRLSGAREAVDTGGVVAHHPRRSSPRRVLDVIGD